MPPLSDEQTRLIRETLTAMSALWRGQRSHRFQHLTHLDISVGQMKTLGILWTGGRQTMGELAQALDVSLGNVTGLVDGLVQRGLVRREEDPADRRQKLASLTPAAEARLRRLEEGNRQMIEQLMGRLALQDLKALHQGLTALAAATGSPPARQSTTLARERSA
jgi:DNA-binding MarR family transcriptional regulator